MLTGLHLDGWIELNEDAFPSIVNALGGITVTVPQPLDDPLYPVGDTTPVTHVHFDQGRQTMSGERALEYVRSRMTTSDTDRRRRQQQVLVAIMQRSRQVNPVLTAFKLVGPLRSGVRTNLTAVDLRDLGRLLQQAAPASAQTLNLDDSQFVHPATGGPAAEEILLPRDGTYASLRHDIQLLIA
jgi:anionic cell wall polymer biosynthesis LytR-Cps2A-Psr (LCP) family protein